jgi:hypothetical protein
MDNDFSYVSPELPLDALLLFAEKPKRPKVQPKLLLKSLVLLQPLRL